MPPDLDEFKSQLLVMDSADASSGHAYEWTFDPANPVAHSAFGVMRDHQLVPHSAVENQAQWPPRVRRGVGPSEAQDSVMFRPGTGGYWSFMIDDDNCYCHTSIEYGQQACNNNDYNRFGVEVMDRSCSESSSMQKSIFMFYRNNSQAPNHRFGTGWEKFWHFTRQQAQVNDMLGMAYGECYMSATRGDGTRYTPAVCPGKMPSGLNINQVEMLAVDSTGDAYRWRFNQNIASSFRAFNSFTRGVEGRWIGGASWNPVQQWGSGRASEAQDAWAYRDACGVKSFALDDDTCYCRTSLEAGKAMCGTGCNNNYGVDRLRDRGCQQPRNNAFNLALYFRVV